MLKKIKKSNIFCSLLKCVFLLSAAYLFFAFVAEGVTISGESMENTLYDMDRIVIDKLSYHFSNPKRFDIVVFSSPYDKNDSIIKRIIGLPGEIVQITEKGEILINGEILVEDYGKESIQEAGIASGSVTLGTDEYFVLGDNRNHSIDSRWTEIGNISKNAIIGKASFCFFSGKICFKKL